MGDGARVGATGEGGGARRSGCAIASRCLLAGKVRDRDA